MHRDRDLVADLQPPGLPDPGERPLDDPADPAQAAAVRHPRGGQLALDPPPLPLGAVARRAIGPVAMHWSRPPARAAAPAADRRDVVEELGQLRRVVPLRPGDPDRQRRSLAVDEQVPLAPFFRPIGGVLAGEDPPKTARMLWLSTADFDQSILSSRPRRLSRARSRRFQTPRRCHSRRRRQQVTPDPQPISSGSIHQGMPLCRTKAIPVKQARSSTGGRPRLPGLALWRGRRGRISSQSSSGTRGPAMSAPPTLKLGSTELLGAYF